MYSAELLNKINSMTKYPSIETYHKLNKSDGTLTEEATPFEGELVVGTEKIDGTNARIIFLPNGRWFIGSREELLTAKDDIIHNPMLGIVDTLRSLAGELEVYPEGNFLVFYLEVYGGKLPAWKNYAASRDTAYRLFDVADYSSVFGEVLDLDIEKIASWRQHGGQEFFEENELDSISRATEIPLVPRLFRLLPEEIPTSIDGMHAFLHEHALMTQATIGGVEPGNAEGIVLRTMSRSTIAKARFEDYARTIRKRDGHEGFRKRTGTPVAN